MRLETPLPPSHCVMEAFYYPPSLTNSWDSDYVKSCTLNSGSIVLFNVFFYIRIFDILLGLVMIYRNSIFRRAVKITFDAVG